MTQAEQRLVAALRSALSDDLQIGVREFEKLYWSLEDDAVPWSSPLGAAIHGFASDLEYFDPAAAPSDGLYDETELRARVNRIVEAVARDFEPTEERGAP